MEPVLITKNYAVIDTYDYYQVVNNSRRILEPLIHKQASSNANNNNRLAFIVKSFLNIPYLSAGAMGEGDWQSSSQTYQAGGVHVRQDPVYRLDGLDCQTFVQVSMAVLHAQSLDEFDQNIIKIAYGAAGNNLNDAVHFYNRNNFVDGDFNPVNRLNGFMQDSHEGALKFDSKQISAVLTRQSWFDQQRNDFLSNVRVLNEKDGNEMAARFQNFYGHLDFPKFNAEQIKISYIPKEAIALLQANGTYAPNEALLEKIPTPAVIEIVRDPAKWLIGGKPIKEVIGSELTISHVGLLYRKNFKKGEIIFHQINCEYDSHKNKLCTVKPVYCEKDACNVLMYAHATHAYPNNYYWYEDTSGSFTCSATLPEGTVKYTTCNRVETLPLFNYLTSFQYGSYIFMNNPSILGVHIEALL